MLKSFVTLLFCVLIGSFCACQGEDANTNNPSPNYIDPWTEELGLPPNRIELPEGYKIRLAAKELENAREMKVASDGTLFCVNPKCRKRLYPARSRW